MLPPPVLLAAIPVVIKIAKWVYDHGFKAHVEGAPDNQYAIFGREVKEFERNLGKLHRTLERAGALRTNHVPSSASDHELDLEPFRGLVGDYEATLRACKRLLMDNDFFETHSNGVVRRIRWSTRLADDIMHLRNRISFHNLRLNAMLKPLELTLYVRLQEDIKRLHDDVRTGFVAVNARLARIEGVILGNVLAETAAAEQDLTEPLPVVPAFLRGRFASTTQTVQPVYVTDQIRLSSLVEHFAHGTQRYRGGVEPGPDTSNFISFWKSVWLMHQLRGSSTYDEFASSELNATVIKEYERLILGETKRFKVNHPALLEDFEKLPSNEFLIWIFEPITPHNNLPEPNLNEVKVFECSLKDHSIVQSRGLVVLASLARPNMLRVVETFTSNIGTRPDMQQQESIDVTKVKLFPTYIQPGATVYNVQMRSSAAATVDSTYSFKDLPDLYSFQQCLTGYYVELELPGLAKVSYKRGGLIGGFARAKVIGNYGRAQIWAHELSKGKAGEPTSTNGSITQSPSTCRQPSTAGVTSHTTSSQSASRTLVGWTSTHTPSVVWRDKHTELSYPETPLVVLTLAITNPDHPGSLPTRYCLFALPLEGLTTIDETRCRCRNQDDDCTRVIICSRSTLTAELFECNHINEMNIALLRRPQWHEERKKNVTDLDDINRVSIDFMSVEDKRDFRKCFRNVVDNYIGLWQDHRKQMAAIKNADYVDRTV